MVHRALVIPMNERDFQNEIDTIKVIANNNGFDNRTIDGIQEEFDKKLATKTACKLNPLEKEINFISLPYIGKISSDIGKILQNKGLTVGYKTTKNIGWFLGNAKDKEPLENRSGVYKLTCGSCDAVYIGQTGRKFKDRINEHISAFKNNKKDNSNFASHLIDNKHEFNPDKFDILHICEKSKKLDYLENLEIQRTIKCNTPCMNEILYVDKSPLTQPIL